MDLGKNAKKLGEAMALPPKMLREQVISAVDYDKHERTVEAYNNKHYPVLAQYPDEKVIELKGIRNANAHAYQSGAIQRDNFPGVARALGTAREWESWVSDKIAGEDNAKDHLRDEWNNDIGRQIGDYAAEHNLSDAQILELVDKARRNGDLIRSISDNAPDARLAKYAGNHWSKGLFGFNEEPTWSGPQPHGLSPLEGVHEKRESRETRGQSGSDKTRAASNGGGFWNELFPGRESLKSMISKWPG